MKKNRINRILQSPIAIIIIIIIIGLLVCLLTIIIAQKIFIIIPGINSINADQRNLYKGIIVSILLIIVYRLFYKKIEKRSTTELSTKRFGKSLISGMIIGIALQSLTMTVIYWNADFKVISVNPLTAAVLPLTIAFTVAIIEEILLRGIVFRIVEEKLGSVIALSLSGMIFGGLHLINPYVTLISVLCISCFGVLLGAAYLYFRNIWFPIAIHFAWNFMQTGIFGTITSGNEKTSSLLTTKIVGFEIVTGGPFGPEGSIQALILCIIATIVLITLLIKQHKLILPYGQTKVLAA